MSYKNLLAIISLFFIGFNSYAHNDSAYYHSSSSLPHNKSWMKYIDNKIGIRNLSIPGTHGSAARYGGDIPRNQTLSITQQLESGIRFLDIRLRHTKDAFAIHHGPIYQHIMFGNVLNQAREFLQHNPSEFIFIRVKEEHQAANNSRTFEDTFNSYVNNNGDIIWTPSYRSQNPSIEEVRGKIVFLQNFAPRKYRWFGLDYHNTFSIQDNHYVTTNWSLYSKWTSIKEHLQQANISKVGHINFLSGSSGNFPYFVASGHSSPSTNAPRLLTGLTTPAWKRTYPDFPRVGCFIGICSIAFEGTNTLTKNYILNNANIKYVGIIAADFPGSGLINSVIETNRRSGFFVEENDQNNCFTHNGIKVCW